MWVPDLYAYSRSIEILTQILYINGHVWMWEMNKIKIIWPFYDIGGQRFLSEMGKLLVETQKFWSWSRYVKNGCLHQVLT